MSNNNRDHALDWVKGCGVLAMAIHHTLNYFPSEWPLLKFVRFVTGLFVFCSGFLVARRFLVGDDSNRRNATRRLVDRAWRLLALVAVLNALSNVLLTGSPFRRSSGGEGLVEQFRHWLTSILITGDFRTVDFALLVPIAYVILSGGLLVRLAPICVRYLPWASLAFALLMCLPATAAPGVYYARYIAIGMLGMGIGCLPDLPQDFLKRWFPLIAGLYLVHAFFLLATPLVFAIYAPIVVLNALFFYSWGSSLDLNARLPTLVRLLGKYSLYNYLLQIVLLQAMARFTTLFNAPLSPTFVAFAFLLGLTTVTTLLTDSVRRRSRVVDTLYRMVF